MLRVQFDSTGTMSVRFPQRKQTARTYALGAAFVQKEESVDPAERCPFYADVAALVSELAQFVGGQQTGEAQRAVASEEVKRLEEEARAYVKQIRAMLQATYFDTPEKAAEWGFDVQQTSPGAVSIRLPRARAGLLALLDAYLGKEESLPAEEQLSRPPLADVQAVHASLSQTLGQRQEGQAQRETNVAQRNETVRRLLDVLQAACVYLVAKNFDYAVSPELQDWGFEIVAK